MWPMCFITMVCLWWFDVGYIYGLGKHHGLYITNIITRCITNIITNWFIYITQGLYFTNITRWLLEFLGNVSTNPKKQA